MYEIKKQIYLNLTKNQKSSLLSYLRAFTKKFFDLKEEEILNKFIEDEKYYLKIDSSRFEFLKEIIGEDTFLTDTLKYITECKKYYENKEKQRPVIEAQKAYEKQKREFLKKVKMSKEPPSKKQLYYYEKLCKKYDLEQIVLTSKLEAMEEIDKILQTYSKNLI